MFYVWRLRYDSTARRNSSAIGAPVLRDNLCSRSSSSSGNQTVVRFFMLRYCDVCQHMSSTKRMRNENKSAELASLLLCGVRGFARDFQAILRGFSHATVDGDCLHCALMLVENARQFSRRALSDTRT